MVIMSDGLLAVASELWLPFALALLLFRDGLVLMRIGVLCNFWIIFLIR